MNKVDYFRSSQHTQYNEVN